jgi:integrin alpha 8
MRERNTSQPRGLSLSLVLLLCGVVLLASPATAKYIFTEEPLARFSPATGDQDLFGYAAALHLVDATGASSDFQHAIQNTKIIVGAPNGSFPGGLEFNITDDDALNNTGLVYVCNISCTSSDCCEALTGNGTGNDIRLFDYQGNSNGRDPFELVVELIVQDEQKSGQFMGATIVSTGEHIMACAPRWISLNTEDYFNGPFDKTRAHGRCFIADRNMENFKLLRPCDMDNSQTLVGQSYCMAGTAASLQEKQEGTDVQVFLGGPPFGESSGAVFSVNLTEAEIAGNSPLNLGSPDFNLIPKANTMQQLWYTGTALTLGRIFGSVEEDLIYSLPKKNVYKGSVEVFSIETGMIEATVLGEQMGEYFGWSVATADLNGDGFDEIIVGAPLFSTPDKIEKGRIFIYKNNGTLDTANPIVIPGTWSRGRYGSAIVNLGDINSDGFEDIAVSAPFESRGGGKGGAEGTVYIYLGSGESVIVTTPEDEITAADISSRLGFDESRVLKSFGYSLSSGVDVDANANNDLVIGGYKQQTVIVFRTHSIANVSLSLSTIPNKLFEYTETNCNISLGDFACFTLEINASFSGRGLDGPLDTKVEVRENAVSAGSRLFFLDSDKNRTDVFEGFLNFSATDTNNSTIKPIPIYVENGIQDRRRPLSVVVTVSPIERVPRDVNGSQDIFDLREFPLLNVVPQNDIEITLSLAGCRNATRCEPDLELTHNSTAYNQQPPSTSPTVVVMASQNEGQVHVTLNYRTLEDDASKSFLRISVDRNVFGTPGIGNVTCDMGPGSTFECFVESIFSHYEDFFTVNVTVPLSTGLVGDEDDSVISFTIVPGNDVDPVLNNNNVDITVDITAVNEVSIQPVIVSPPVTQYEDTDEIGQQEISTRVTLIGSGPSTIPVSTLTILIPGKTEDTGDFYYLYPTGYTESVLVNCSGLNPDRLEQFINQQRRRRRRQTPQPGIMERLWREVTREGVREEEELPLGKRQEMEPSVNCSRNPGVCTPIQCTVENFGTGIITITVTSVVDNRYFRNQKGDFTFVMRADYVIDSDFFEQTSSGSEKSNLLKVRGLPTTVERPVPVWVYVVSALVAIIIITLIVIALFLLVICLRRRTKKKIRRATERRRSRHGTVTAGTGGGAVVTSMDTKPVEDPDEKPKPLPENSGDDTPDNPTAPPAEDPDETEL